MTWTAEEIKNLLPYMTASEKAEVYKLINAKPPVWEPLPGPQTMAYNSKAKIVGYGGAAGGGKTDLACGKATTAHKRVIIFRREGTQLTAIVDRIKALIGDDGYNGSEKIWRLKDRQIELGAVQHLGDEKKYQGRPHDLIVFDETTNFLEFQVRFLMGWLRTEDHNQICQVLMTFNPPTDNDGMWIIPFFGPWLDKNHPRKAMPGEIRWFLQLGEKEIEVEDDRPHTVNGKIVYPNSRTFIPSRVSDNIYYAGTDYERTLMAMPEPLRSQMLEGDFEAGIQEDPWQVIPTKWVEMAMAKWTMPDKKPEMDSLGIDVARGGRDQTVIARRHGMWFDEPLTYPGKETPDGPSVAGLCIAAARDNSAMHIDVIGVGSSPYDFLMQSSQHVIGVNVAEKSYAKDKSDSLRFFNVRSELWWKMREALDPANNTGIVLPRSDLLKSDLCAPKWNLSGSTIRVESREDIYSRIGRSPDLGSAYILALMNTPKLKKLLNKIGVRGENKFNYDPIEAMTKRSNINRGY